MIRWRGVAMAAVLVPLWILLQTPGTPEHSDPGAMRAFDAVVVGRFDPAHPTDAFPADYRQVMGYEPRTATGPRGEPILFTPLGECSGPTGPTDYDFELVCKEHDLAYDIIRYADQIGAPLPIAARQTADRMFDSELHAHCDQLPLTDASFAMCHTYAFSFAWVVAVNSWRQSYRTPFPEHQVTLSAYLLVVVGAVGPWFLSRRRSPGWPGPLIEPRPVRRPTRARPAAAIRSRRTQSADLVSH